jgi:hypothetical protein
VLTSFGKPVIDEKPEKFAPRIVHKKFILFAV